MPGIAETMREYKAGRLHSGSSTGPLVASRKQAIAIALHNADENDDLVKIDDAEAKKKQNEMQRKALKNAR